MLSFSCHLSQSVLCVAKTLTLHYALAVAEENKYRSGQGSLSEENKTYESLYEGLIKEYEASAKRLREEQKEAKVSRERGREEREGRGREERIYRASHWKLCGLVLFGTNPRKLQLCRKNGKRL